MAKKREGRKEADEDQGNELIQEAYKEGIQEFAKKYPAFAGKGASYIGEYFIDKKKIEGKVQEIQEKFQKEKIAPEKQAEYLRKELTDYIAAGGIISDKGRAILDGKGLESKVKRTFWGKIIDFGKYKDGREVKPEGSFYKEASDFIAEDRMFQGLAPGVVEAIVKGGASEKAGYLANMGKYHGKMSDSEYNQVQANVKEGLTKYDTKFGKSLVQLSQQLAASIFGIMGLFFLVDSQMKMTGGVVGVQEGSVTTFFALILLAIVIALFFKWQKLKIRKSVKVKKKKK